MSASYSLLSFKAVGGSLQSGITDGSYSACNRIKAATDYIAEQNRIFYMKWTTYMRESPEDERVSCVLYFVNPHAIKPVDLEIMAAIGKAAPLVPVIAKVSHSCFLFLGCYFAGTWL